MLSKSKTFICTHRNDLHRCHQAKVLSFTSCSLKFTIYTHTHTECASQVVEFFFESAVFVIFSTYTLPHLIYTFYILYIYIHILPQKIEKNKKKKKERKNFPSRQLFDSQKKVPR